MQRLSQTKHSFTPLPKPKERAYSDIQKIPYLVYTQPLNPLTTFQQWFQEAARDHRIDNAGVVNLATVSPSGLPSNRMVTLKKHDASGFVFFTHNSSHKGEDMKANPRTALCFYWAPLGKQIRVEGRVQPVGCEDADTYFSELPRRDQVRAWISDQSKPIASASQLDHEIMRHTERFDGVRIPRPASWTGFRIVPHTIEFCERGEFGTYHRQSYVRNADNTWTREALAP